MVTPIKHAPRLTLTQLGRAILTTGPKRPWEVAQFLTEVYRLGAKVGYDPVALIGQCCFETAVNGVPFASDLWNSYLNPAGIGQTDSGPSDRLETNDPLVAARAYLAHIGGYIEGPDGGWLKDTTYKSLDPRWKYLGKDQFGKVQNVEDLGGGLWASTATPKSQYTAGVLQYMKLMGWQGDAVNPAPKPVPAPKPTGKLPYILLVAGHRSTGSGGQADSDPTEASLTQFLAADYETAFKAAGYPCDWWQADLDGDTLPTLTAGNLDTVALGCARVLRGRNDALSIMIDCHYNGPHSPVHVIVPDAVGLTTAYQGGAPADDTAANNVWDVDFAQRASAALRSVTGGAVYQGDHSPAPGVMSERDCGVGLDGYRLAMFAATTDSRAKAVRVIFEHGGYQDPAQQQADFTSKCATAVIAATNEFVTTTVAKG